MIGGSDQVADIGGKIRVLKLSLGRPQPREVEPQGCNPEGGQLRRNVTSCNNVFRAREAMRKQRVGADGSRRQVQPRRQLVTETTCESRSNHTRAHDGLPKRRAVDARLERGGPSGPGTSSFYQSSRMDAR